MFRCDINKKNTYSLLGEEKSLRMISLEMNEFYLEMAQTLKRLRQDRRKTINAIDDDHMSIISAETEEKFKNDPEISGEFDNIKKMDMELFDLDTVLKVNVLSIVASDYHSGNSRYNICNSLP